MTEAGPPRSAGRHTEGWSVTSTGWSTAGGEPCPASLRALEAWCTAGGRIVYATNNASRPPQTVAEHLVGLGAPATVDQVLTSAQVGAGYLARTLPCRGRRPRRGRARRPGGPWPRLASSRWPRQVRRSSRSCRGTARTCGPQDLNEAAFAVRAGALWVATNTDRTIPTGRGSARERDARRRRRRGERGPAHRRRQARSPRWRWAAPNGWACRSTSASPSGTGWTPTSAVASGLAWTPWWVLSGVHGLADLLRFPEVTPTWVAADLAGLTKGASRLAGPGRR